MAKPVKKGKPGNRKQVSEKALKKAGQGQGFAQKNGPNPNPGLLSQKYVLPAVVFAFAFLLYSNTLNHSHAIDDDIVTGNNVFVQKGFSGIPGIFSKGFLYGFNGANDQSYRPVSLFSFAVEVGIWGDNPKSHHYFNVLWYSIACLVLFLLLKRMFKNHSVWLSLVIALLFAAHPVHTEAVANFKSRDEVLMLLFLTSALLNLIRYTVSRKYIDMAWSFIFFFLAMLTKEQAVTFIAIIPLFLFFFTGSSYKRIVILILPFLAATGLYIFIRAHILDTMTFADKMNILNNALVAAPNTAALATAILILGKYLALLFPHP